MSAYTLAVPALIRLMKLYRFLQSIVWHCTNSFRLHFHFSVIRRTSNSNPLLTTVQRAWQLLVLLITTIHHTSYFVTRFH